MGLGRDEERGLALLCEHGAGAAAVFVDAFAVDEASAGEAVDGAAGAAAREQALGGEVLNARAAAEVQAQQHLKLGMGDAKGAPQIVFDARKHAGLRDDEAAPRAPLQLGEQRHGPWLTLRRRPVQSVCVRTQLDPLPRDLQGRVVVVTGATGGIGQHTAEALLRRGARVIVTGRRQEAADAALAALRARVADADVDAVLGDLETRAGVADVARGVRALLEHGGAPARLDALVHNAGLMPSERALTKDGLERGFAVNVAAPLLLTRALLPALRAAPAGRVVVVTGGDHPRALDLENLDGARGFVGLVHYSHNKLVMMAAMRALARRLGGQPQVSVCYPGQAATAMTQGVKPGDMPLALRVIYPLFRWFVRDDGGASAARAARSSVALAADAAFADANDVYVDKEVRRVPWPRAIADPATCEAAYARVAGLVGFDGDAWS